MEHGVLAEEIYYKELEWTKKIIGFKSNMENKNRNKRQIYVQPDNLAFYDSLRNKAGLINRLLRKYREETEG